MSPVFTRLPTRVPIGPTQMLVGLTGDRQSVQMARSRSRLTRMETYIEIRDQVGVRSAPQVYRGQRVGLALLAIQPAQRWLFIAGAVMSGHLQIQGRLGARAHRRFIIIQM